MSELWKNYSTKFLAITPREQYLILFTGLVAIVFIGFTLFVDEKLTQITQVKKQLRQVTLSNKTANSTINILQQSLAQNPNVSIQKQITQYESKLQSVDNELLLLTTDLINPIQMRIALVDLLKTQKNVALLSFEVFPAQEVIVSSPEQQAQKLSENIDINEDEVSESSLTLYKHGIKIKLKGRYFALKNYLYQLENLDWKFFWQSFDYQLTEYPNSELTLEMYSLSTTKEFIGV